MVSGGALSSAADELAAFTVRVAAIDDPIERVAQVSELARQLGGTLPSSLAELRRVAMVEARAMGHSTAEIAARAGVSRQRIHQLTTTKAAPAGVEAPPAPECLD